MSWHAWTLTPAVVAHTVGAGAAAPCKPKPFWWGDEPRTSEPTTATIAPGLTATVVDDGLGFRVTASDGRELVHVEDDYWNSFMYWAPTVDGRAFLVNEVHPHSAG